MSDRMFPMQRGPSIPWETAEVVYRAYSRLYGTGQSLQRMAERGGFGWAEVPVIFAELRRKDPALWWELMQKPCPLPPQQPAPVASVTITTAPRYLIHEPTTGRRYWSDDPERKQVDLPARSTSPTAPDVGGERS